MHVTPRKNHSNSLLPTSPDTTEPSYVHFRRSNHILPLLTRNLQSLHLILEHLLILRQEDLALPERHACEDDEDEPDDTNDGGHDGVDGVEALDVQCVSEGARSRDPANCSLRVGGLDKMAT